MKEHLLNFIKENQLFNKEDKILLTVSGGIDSMSMLHLFKDCDFNFAIAHCNFNLRGADSDGDEELVIRTAQKLGIPIHINKFDTLKYADNHKLSIQMAARELRYTWFDRLAKENNYVNIATAHNANDVAETFFINLTRGTGIHGLTGINLVNKNIIRPLLFATRAEIVEFANEFKVEYREDKSNADTKYMRNEIRHNILPHFEKLNASFLKNISHTTKILKDAEGIFNKHIDKLRTKIISTKGKLLHLDISSIKMQKVTPALLYEILAPYSFSFDTSIKMLKNISAQPGAVFFSKTHKIVKDRTSYILYPLTCNEEEEYIIEENQIKHEGAIELLINKTLVNKDFVLKRNREVGTFDADKIKFPLKLRHWNHGDYFYPFGMRGKKKLSDYFSDQKISIPEKENTWILCSGEDIVWVVNHRTDNRYCLTNSTKEVIQIELIC